MLFPHIQQRAMLFPLIHCGKSIPVEYTVEKAQLAVEYTVEKAYSQRGKSKQHLSLLLNECTELKGKRRPTYDSFGRLQRVTCQGNFC